MSPLFYSVPVSRRLAHNKRGARRQPPAHLLLEPLCPNPPQHRNTHPFPRRYRIEYLLEVTVPLRPHHGHSRPPLIGSGRVPYRFDRNRSQKLSDHRTQYKSVTKILRVSQTPLRPNVLSTAAVGRIGAPTGREKPRSLSAPTFRSP